MSLEQALKANTEAVKALHALLAGGELNSIAQVNEPVEPKVESKPEPKTERKVATQPEVKPEATADKVSYETMRTAVLDLNKKVGREETVEVLSAFGADRLPDIEPAQFPALLAKINEILEN